MLKILVSEKDGICGIAASEVVSLWKQITGENLAVITEDDSQSDLIVLGSDAYNAFTHAKIVEKVIPQFSIASGTDGYQLRSAVDVNGRNLLFIAGARPRALLYGVYRFFELRANCRYFWDGDIIPESKTIDITGLDLKENPRFQYRGLRYFAHRSLSRFQAEHWDFPEWKREIDWILKKRMNLFMLRIGLDDLFQKAFPETVSYPEGYIIDNSVPRSYDDHTLFWSLEYRSELRKKVLEYARERDLLHPEDIGTMTHWYSRTPNEYLDKVKPDFIPQADGFYNEKSGLVWDIRQEKNLDAYWKLTETHIREYGSPDIFHTIGLAERRCYNDRESNQQMKLYTYRRLQKKLREHYPNAPLLIASWDFCMFWEPDEVQELLKELDPDRTIIFDYTSDNDDESLNFLHWGVLGKFPWIFGIFHAFEPDTEPRGNYEVIARRLRIASEDPMCRGFVLWPENSHADTLMIEFCAANSWNPEAGNREISSFIERFCANRYNEDKRDQMLTLWRDALPLITAEYWHGPALRRRANCLCQQKIIFWTARYLIRFNTEKTYLRAQYALLTLKAMQAAGISLLRRFAEFDITKENTFIQRDIFDLIRTVGSRGLCFLFDCLVVAIQNWQTGKDNAGEVENCFNELRTGYVLFADILAGWDEFSLYASLCDLQQKHSTNPNFEYTLKGNSENGYCRSYITELFTQVYIPELDVSREIWREANQSGKRLWDEDKNWRDPRFAAVQDRFYETPLKDIAPNAAVAIKELPDNLKKLADLLERNAINRQ